MRYWIALSCLLLLGCGGTPTELVVVVDTDLAIGVAIDTVRMQVTNETGRTAGVTDFPLGTTNEAPGVYTVPFSFVVTPADEDRAPEVDILLTARSPDRQPILTRRARTGLIDGNRVRLVLPLLKSCASTSCGEEETCAENGCRPVAVSASELEEVEAGKEFDGL